MIPKQLYLHTSNRIENLAGRLVDASASQPLATALSPETVMTPNPGMARWLRFEIARRTGVSFGWDYPLPSKLFAQILTGFSPNFKTAGALPEDLARWHLSEILSKLEDSPRFSLLRGYCQASSPTRRFSFASRLTKLFDEYLVYRPETIIEWEDEQSNFDWQAEIWRRLMRSLFPSENRPRHIARIWNELRLGQATTLSPNTEIWPERLFVFGISSLAPLYLDILDTFAQYRPVHIFLLQPSDLYWADLKTTKDIHKIINKTKKSSSGAKVSLSEIRPEDWLYETGNPLLPAFGKQSQMFLDLLIDKDPIQDDLAFSPPNETTQLSAVQSDLFTITDRGESDDKPFPNYDGTIQIHSCASRRREIETLWDYIVRRFDSDPALGASQILVMAPDIQTYRSHVEAVFESKRGTSLEIPYTIADGNSNSQSGVISGLRAILEIPASRANASAILALLETPLLREAFRLTENDLERIEYWIRELGITWGWDTSHRGQHDGFATNRNSWKELQSRLAAGLAFGEAIKTPSGFLAYSELEGDLSDTAGRFLECLDLLNALRESYRQTHSIDTWQERFLTWLNRLRVDRDDWQDDFQRVTELIRETVPDLPNILASGAEAFHALLDKLNHESGGGGYLSGGVTFCSLKPMRAIPADTICLVGMNRLDFPRRTNRLSFELLARSTRIGDRNTRDDDRQLFLETLLSVRSHLFLSYQGFESTSDAKKEPSSIIEELQSYLRRALPDDEFAELLKIQKRQAFDSFYFQDGPNLTYDPDRAALRNRFNTPFSIATAKPAPEAEPITEIDLEQLVNFFRHPAKAFAQEIANARLISSEDSLPEIDSIKQDPLDRYKVRQAFVDTIINGDSIEGITIESLAADKTLPPGLLERSTFLAEQERAVALAPFIPANNEDAQFAQIEIADVALAGSVKLDPKTGKQILLHAGELKSRRIVEVWIRHLFAQCAAPNFTGETLVFTLHDKGQHLKFSGEEDARKSLDKLVELYKSGQQTPLPLFPELSEICFKAWKKAGGAEDPWAIKTALAAGTRAMSSGQEESQFFRTFDWTAIDRFCFGEKFILEPSHIELAIDFWRPIDAATGSLKLAKLES